MSLLIGVPREVFPGEKRVASVPEVVEKLIKQGFRVAVEAGAGDAAQISDDAYRAAGAELVPDRHTLWSAANIIFKVRAPNDEEVGLLREGQVLVSFIWPAQNTGLMQQLAARKVTVLAVKPGPSAVITDKGGRPCLRTRSSTNSAVGADMLPCRRRTSRSSLRLPCGKASATSIASTTFAPPG